MRPASDRRVEVSSVVETVSDRVELDNEVDNAASQYAVLDDLLQNDEPAKLKLNSCIEFEADDAGRATLIKTADFYFKSLMKDLSKMSSTPMQQGSADPQHYRRIANAFHELVAERLSEGDTTGMNEEEMREFTKEWENVEGMLSDGVASYIENLRELFRPNAETFKVDVRFKNLTYVVNVQQQTSKHQYPTVGSVMTTPCRSFANLVSYCCGGTSSVEEANDYQRLDDQAGTKTVLNNLSGVIEHGRLTMVLGPPSAGKSSFLKAISGQLPQSSVSGEILFNTCKVADVTRLSNWAQYVPQSDEHLARLTARETLEFAHKCKSARLDNPEYKEKLSQRVGLKAAERILALGKSSVDFILAVLGLDVCSETLIGNQTLKGVSGGEKRRVTLAEFLVVGARVLCCDEIGIGLDSRTTLEITQFLNLVAHFLDKTVVVSLLQPQPEVLELFDDIILFSPNGHIIYHGPIPSILDYFATLGFKCPARKDLSEFLLDLMTPQGEEFATRSDIPRTSEDFAQCWKESALYQTQVVKKLEQIPPNDFSDQLDSLPKNDFLTELRLLVWRSWKIRMRNPAKIKARVFQNLFSGIVFGTLFYQVGEDEWYLKAMLFGQVPAFMLAGCFGNINPIMQDRPVFYKQYRAEFLSSFAYVLSEYIVTIPFKVFDTMVFGNLIYFMCGLAPVVSSYAVFIIISFLFGQCIDMMILVFASGFADSNSAVVGAVFTYLLFLILSGRVATPDVIPDLLKWFYWANPLSWAYQSLTVNEFKSSAKNYDDFPCVDVKTNITVYMRCGDVYLKNRQFQTDQVYVLLGIIILLCYTFVFMIAASTILAKVHFTSGHVVKKETSLNDKKDEQAAVAEGSDVQIELGELAKLESKTLTFSNVWYTVPLDGLESVDILKGVNGFCRPGRMTALMGSSGAGKTTLLDVLADRKTVGTIKGDIMLNGQSKATLGQSTWKRMIGYVEQFGIHLQSATVRESLLFSAKFRLSKADLEGDYEGFVDMVLETLELVSIQSELVRNLSMEQNKRLTIGVEVAAKTSVLFCDEPTTSLAQNAAEGVMKCLHNLAVKFNCNVLATIHCPSLSVFRKFDDLLLLKRGGKVVFFGPLGKDCCNLIGYFEKLAGVKPCPAGYNPATWMLEVLGDYGKTHDFASYYAKSSMHEKNVSRLGKLSKRPHGLSSYSSSSSSVLDPSNLSLCRSPGTPRSRRMLRTASSLRTVELVEVNDGTEVVCETRRSFCQQVMLLLDRDWRMYWRSPNFSLGRVFTLSSVTIALTFIFWHQDYYSAADVQSRIAAINLIVLLGGNHNLFNIIPFAVTRRALFYRETASGMYSGSAAVLADGIVELPYLAFQTLLAVNISYWGIGFDPDAFVFTIYIVTFFVFLQTMTNFGLLLAALMPDVFSAQILGNVLITLLNISAGVTVPFTQLPAFFKAFYYLSPIRMASDTLVASQFFEDDSIICSPRGMPSADTLPCDCTDQYGNKTGVALKASDYVLDDFLEGYSWNDKYENIVYLLVWSVGLRIAAILATRYIDHNRR